MIDGVTTPAERLLLLARALAQPVRRGVLDIHAAQVEILKRALGVPFANIEAQMELFAECMATITGGGDAQ